MNNNSNSANVSRETIENQVQGVFNETMERAVYDASGLSEKTTKKGNMVVQKKYDFAVKLGNRVSMTISDPEIIRSTELIFQAKLGQKVMGYVICKEMARIADSGKLEKMGFKNAAEYGKAMFGFETSTTNHYVRIGRNFITDNYHVIDGLPELSISHFIELNKYVKEDGDVSDIVDMYLDGTLVDGMSTKDVRKALVAHENTIEADFVDSDDSTDSTDSTEVKSGDSKGKKGKKETSRLAGDSDDSAEFDANVECGKALNAIAAFAESMAKLNANGVQVSGFETMLDNLTTMVKALIQ